ncbi:hypothetical protein Heshes_25730 [Alicyclobacillus hesperidum]|uniref:Uncharacterized protein n=1 Tax=Alicyclobacillus hesperidum TaxID=89784 RepID=A0AA37X750_9BACL|nr:hypothetical protein Heshes_25730 [Alicyclobacillus hesperidum]
MSAFIDGSVKDHAIRIEHQADERLGKWEVYDKVTYDTTKRLVFHKSALEVENARASVPLVCTSVVGRLQDVRVQCDVFESDTCRSIAHLE